MAKSSEDKELAQIQKDNAKLQKDIDKLQKEQDKQKAKEEKELQKEIDKSIDPETKKIQKNINKDIKGLQKLKAQQEKRAAREAEKAANAEKRAKFKSAFDNFENKLQESTTGFSIIALKNKITSAVNKMSNKNITALNELGAAGDEKLSKKLGDKLAAAAKDFSKQATNMIKDIAKDAVNQALTAGLAFVGNIVEDLISNIEKAIYLPDELVLATLMGSYETGADLAYHNHTIRNFALTHDLAKTLEWVDEQYTSKGYVKKYTTDYKDLNKDLSTAAKNSCWKNIKYMYKSLYKEHQEYTVEKAAIETYLENYFSTDESRKLQPDIYKENVDLAKRYAEKCDKIERLMLEYFRILVTYSYTHLNVSAVKEFFDDYSDIMLPKYFGDTDDKYGKGYVFTASDAAIMMPFFKQHKQSITDTVLPAFSAINDAKVKANIKLENKMDALNGTSTKLNEFRENVYNKQSSKGASLLQTATKSGSGAVLDEIKEQYYQNADGIIVKKRFNVVREGISTFLDEPQYITQRNKNIKAIYSYLASDVIFADNKMVNKAFYERCTYQTDDVLTSSLSKAKGILGSSHLVQSVFDVGDFLDSTGYKFIMVSKDYIFDPKKNVSVLNFGDNYQDTFSNFESIQDITKYIEDAKKNAEYAESVTGESASTEASYTDLSKINENITHLEELIVNNATIRAKLESIFRFVDEIPLVKQRDIILKYLNFFYDEMINSRMPSRYISDTCFKLMNYVFGSPGHDDFSKLAGLMDSMDIRYLRTCLRILLALYYLNNLTDELDINNNYKKIITKEYRISISMLSREIQSTGFTKTIYEYDQHFLQSLTKQTYYKAIEDMKLLNDKTTSDDHILLNKLDNMTNTFTGYNRGGILGWDDNAKKIKYTEYETKDYHDVKCTKSGTFVSGYNIVNSVGILKYDYPSEEFIRTNINYGSYDIYDFNNGVFFKNIEDGEILYWNGSSCVSKLIFDNPVLGNDFSLVELPNNLVICVSNSNNGIYYWDKRDKQFIKLDSSGGQYSWYKVKNGWLLFSKNNESSFVYIATSEYLKKIDNLKGAYSSYVDYVAEVTISGTYTPPGGDGQGGSSSGSGSGSGQTTSQQISKTSDIYNILLSRNTLGFDRIYVVSDTSSYGTDFTYDNSNTLFITEKLLFAFSSDEDACYIVHNRKSIPDISVDTVEYHKFKTEFTRNVGTLSSPTFNASDYFDSSTFRDIFESSTGTRDKTSSNKTDGVSNYSLTNKGLFFIFDNVWYCYNDHLQVGLNFPDATKSSLSDFKFIDFNDKVFGVSDTEILYFSEDNLKDKIIDLTHVLDEKDRVKGWKFEKIKCQTSATNTKYLEYLTNIESPIGTRFYNPETNRAINVNLNNGYWKIYFAGSKFIAASYNACNEGLRISEYEMTPFFDFIKEETNLNSYSSGDYDYQTKRLYLCSCREDTVWNIEKIPYDIDEFVYPLDEYKMQKIVTEHNEQSFTDLIDIIGNRFYDDEVFINNDVLNQYDDEDNELEGGNISSDPIEVPKGKYSLDDILKILNEHLDSFDAYLSEIIASSGLFAEIFTYAETAVNFDPDDEKSMQNLQAALLMLYSLDDEGNINFTNILARYKAYIRKVFIKNNTTSSGEVITESTDSEEWNKKYNYSSDDFLDSDETAESYSFKEKENPIEYVKLNPEDFDKEESDAFISKRYGITLYYRLLKNNSRSDYAYFRTDYETEYKYFVKNEEYRDLYVIKSDLEIIKKYPQNNV